MNIRTALLATTLTLAAGLCQAQATIDQNKALAGNITPGDTAGFPITLSVPGHYKLMGNLSVPAGAAAFVISAPNVTLDFNGFSVVGPTTCSRVAATRVVTCVSVGAIGSAGIYLAQAAGGAVIRNGTLRGFSSAGMQSQADSLTLEGMRITESREIGLDALNNPTVRISNSLFDLNGESGAFPGYGAVLIERTRFLNNGLHGVLSGARTLVVDSLAMGNKEFGVAGASGAVVVRGTLASGNGTDLANTIQKD